MDDTEKITGIKNVLQIEKLVIAARIEPLTGSVQLSASNRSLIATSSPCTGLSRFKRRNTARRYRRHDISGQYETLS